MIKKRQRLSRAECAHVLKRGRRVHSKHMTLVHATAPCDTTSTVPTATPKCTVIVGKKAARKAVVRHQVRRKVYDALPSTFPALEGLHVAVIAKAGIAERSASEVQDELAGLAAQR